MTTKMNITRGDRVRVIGRALDCIVVAVEDFHGFASVVLRSEDGRWATRTNPYNVEHID